MCAAALQVKRGERPGALREEPRRGEPAVAQPRGPVDGGLGGRSDPHLDGIGWTRGDASIVEMIAAVGAHGLAREQAPHGVEPLLERRRPVLQVGAHGVELLGAVTDAALEDEASLGDGRERADLLGDEHGLPERQENRHPAGASPHSASSRPSIGTFW